MTEINSGLNEFSPLGTAVPHGEANVTMTENILPKLSLYPRSNLTEGIEKLATALLNFQEFAHGVSNFLKEPQL